MNTLNRIYWSMVSIMLICFLFGQIVEGLSVSFGILFLRYVMYKREKYERAVR